MCVLELAGPVELREFDEVLAVCARAGAVVADRVLTGCALGAVPSTEVEGLATGVVCVGVGAGGLGSAVKVTVVLKVTGQLPAPEPEFELLELPLVELCRLTSLTPLIKRSRDNATATSDWLRVQPVIVMVGTLPGGVAELAELLLADELGADELGAELVVDLELPDPPMAPATVLSETFVGSTLPSSWKACAQSKRVPISSDTVLTRSS